MAELAPIRDCVERFVSNPEAVEILREVYKRRPGIMAKQQQHQFMTLADVLKAATSETFKWTASRKAVVVEAVHDGKLSGADVEKRFGVSAEEFGSWSRSLENHGVAGLRSSRVQIYEPQRRKGYKAPGSRPRAGVPAVHAR
jgi:transposase-like protein